MKKATGCTCCAAAAEMWAARGPSMFTAPTQSRAAGFTSQKPGPKTAVHSIDLPGSSFEPGKREIA